MTSDINLDKLQRVQNKLARVVLGVVPRERHSIDLLRDLHWLPVRSRITFKISIMCYRALQTGEPSYLKDVLRQHRPVRTLRSADLNLLTEPVSRTKTAARRFSCSGPRVWNTLPQTIRTSNSLATFKTQLKTHFFTGAFDNH